MAAEKPSEGLPDEIISSSADQNLDLPPDDFPNPRFPRAVNRIKEFWDRENHRRDAEERRPIFGQPNEGSQIPQDSGVVIFRSQQRLSSATFRTKIPGRMRR